MTGQQRGIWRESWLARLIEFALSLARQRGLGVWVEKGKTLIPMANRDEETSSSTGTWVKQIL